MIICPVTSDECTKPVTPHPKTALIMAPSEEKTTQSLERTLDNIISILEAYPLKFKKGAEIVDYGDYLCSICKTIQGCPFGIAIASSDIPRDALCNVFWEMGLMQGFGKPVILFVDEKKSLPSDFVRNFTIFLDKTEHQKKFKELLRSINEREEYYSDTLGDTAFGAGDYEKAGRYYKEAYLISASNNAFQKVDQLVTTLKDASDIPTGFKKRLLEDLTTFKAEASRQQRQPN
jgi:hypothetical protein